MPPVGFETTISAGMRPQTYAFDRTTTGTGSNFQLPLENLDIYHWEDCYSDIKFLNGLPFNIKKILIIQEHLKLF